MPQFVFDPGDIQQIGIGVSAFIITIGAVFLFLFARNDRAGRAMLYGFIAALVWGWCSFFYRATDDFGLAREFRVLASIGSLSITTLFVNFAFVYLQEERPLSRLEQMIRFTILGGAALLNLIFVSDLLGTRMLIGDFHVSPRQALAPDAGPFLWVVIGYQIIEAGVMAIALTARARLASSVRVRRQARLLFVGLTLGTALAFTRWTPWYGLDFMPMLGALAVPLFVGSAFVAIKSYRMFNVRMAAAELLVFIIWIFTFFRALLSSDVRSAIPDIILFPALIALGIVLLRSIRKEERLSAELQTFNDTLENKVKERTEELWRTGAHIERIIENLPVGLLEIRETGIVTRMNPAAERLLGVSRRSVLQANVSKVPASMRAVVEAKPDPHSASPDAVDVSIRKPEHRELQVVTVPLALEDGTKGSMRLIRDVTRERLLDRAKSEFVSIAAHQLRTPTAALRWVYELLGHERLTKRQRGIADKGRIAADTMVRLINTFLDVARISDGRFTYRFGMHDVHDVLISVLVSLESSAQNKNVRLDFEPSQHAIARIDPDKLELALQNLVDNAIRYSPSGGAVRISLEPIPEGAKVTIVDKGIGISREEQARLFEKFFRGRRAMQVATAGSGLGLFVVRTVIDDHGGTISIDSEEGRGTSVTVMLPAGTPETS